MREIDRALAEHRRRLRPASVQEFAALTDGMLRWMTVFGIDLKEPRAVTEAYRAALGGMPVDLLIAAYTRMQANWTWRTVPLPGDVRKMVEDEFGERRRELDRLEFAAERCRVPLSAPGRMSDAEYVHCQALRAANRRWLDGAASPEDLDLLNAVRARHGDGPLPPRPDGLGLRQMRSGRRVRG